jgi:MFS family permease
LKYITRTIWILSLVSLFTDVGSEMLYPILPLYLKSIGFSIVLIGILEGVAEATIGLSKGYFGRRSDSIGKRVPFVQFGYTLSVIAKPLMILFVHPLWVFLTRTMDRLGKGIRTGARDALLSDEATPQTKGRVFGFHRGMDTLGAVFGPAIALMYLYFHPGAYKTLFLISIFPGIIVILISLLLREKKKDKIGRPGSGSFLSFISYWKESPKMFRQVVIGLLVLALVNSSDVFLLLRLKDVGLTDTYIIGVYIFYNLIYAILALPMGILADKMGLKKTFLLGLGLFVITYFGMSFKTDICIYLLLFACYGAFYAATEGIAKAWISNIAAKEDTATAIGFYSGFQSIALLLASSLTGLIWYSFGPAYAFMITAVVAVGVMVYFILLKKPEGLEVK